MSENGSSPAKALFLGSILHDHLFPFPRIKEGERETIQMVVDSVERFMSSKEEEYRKHDVEGNQPTGYLDELKELGLFSLIIPEEHGGLGLSNAAYSRVLQQTSRFDPSTSLTVGAHSSIGMKALLLFGNDEQKAKYLPRLASGELIAAFCLTEPGAGSDAASIKTTAVRNDDGTFTLNGEKIWITNGGIAGFYTVFARTEVNEGKMTAFIVEREFPGVSSGPKEDKMGIRSSNTTSVIFNNVRVPESCVLGEAGKGFKVAMAVLNNGRTGLGGGCVGGMKRLIELSTRQANERKQFGKRIADFSLIKAKIASMTTQCFAAESVVNMVASFIDQDYPDYSVEAAMSKVFATEAMWDVADEALQVAGGNGFMREYPYERMVRDCRINRIFEGTNEILRLFIGLSGMKDAGDQLKDVARGLKGIFNDPIKGFGVLSSYATKKVGHFTPFGRERVESVHPALKSEKAQFEFGAAKFAHSVEAVLKRYGRDIIGAQAETKRLADTATDLFVGLCVLSRVSTLVESQGVDKSERELAIAKIFAHDARVRIGQNIRALTFNEDTTVNRLSDLIVEDGGYRWDVI